MTEALAAQAARQAFPRGLRQPEGGFRFSLDALLLAAFVSGETCRVFVDLGTGCGVVGLALCLLHPRLEGLGLETDAALVDAARHNARLLGLEGRFTPLRATLPQLPGALSAGSFDLVAGNPPWPFLGKLPPDSRRALALADPGTVLEDFLPPARRLLRHKGRLALVYAAGGLAPLLEALRAYHLEPKRLRCVHSREGRPASTILVEARKNARPGLHVEPPLILYTNNGPRAHSPQALAFCPFLACNDKPAGE